MHSAGALHGGVRWEWGAECEGPTVTTTEEASQAEMPDGSPGAEGQCSEGARGRVSGEGQVGWGLGAWRDARWSWCVVLTQLEHGGCTWQ